MDLLGISMNNQKWQSLTISDLLEHREEWNIVDIRDGNSFAQGHIPGAINLNNNNIQQYVDEHEFETPLVVVCYVGNSSKGAAEIMAGAGFDTVYSLEGGMKQWSMMQPDLIAYD